MSTSLVILITVVVIGVACNGLLQIGQMKVIERIQQKIFVRYSFAFTAHIQSWIYTKPTATTCPNW
jgi:hypothetical protein